MRISVFNSEKLQAIILGLRGFDAELRKQIRTHTRAGISESWAPAVRAETTSRMESRVLGDTARVRVSDQNVTLASAGVGRALSGGARPPQIWHGVEFGANAKRTAVTARSRKGKTYRYTRTVNRQFKTPNRRGYAVYPAAAKMIPRYAALWAQTVVRTFHETMEGKR